MLDNFSKSFDSIIKGPVTSLISVVLLCACGYGWWTDYLTDSQAIGGGVVALILLFMRDKLPDYLGKLLTTLIDKVTSFFPSKNNGNPPAAPTAMIALFLLSSFAAIGQTDDPTMSTNNLNNIKKLPYDPVRAYNNAQSIIDNKANLNLNLYSDRGNYDASSNAFPSTGGSGTSGAIKRGNIWTISVAGTLGGTAVSPGQTVRALVDSPGSTSSNWNISASLANVPTSRTISTTSPLAGGGDLTANRTLSIANAVSDGSTKGAASFTASDFNDASGNISLDYTNGQSSNTSTKGFLTSTDWNTFNNKVGTTRTISTTSPLSGGGDLSANRTISIADAAADGSTKGAATFTASDFNATSGNISIDYTNSNILSRTGTTSLLSNGEWDNVSGSSSNYVVWDKGTNKTDIAIGGASSTGSTDVYFDPSNFNGFGKGFIIQNAGDNYSYTKSDKVYYDVDSIVFKNRDATILSHYNGFLSITPNGPNSAVGLTTIDGSTGFVTQEDQGGTGKVAYMVASSNDNLTTAQLTFDPTNQLGNGAGYFFTEVSGGTKKGIQYAGSGYVTQTHSLADKSYVDTSISALFASGTATLDFPQVTSTTVQDLTMTVTGAVNGRPCIVGAPNGSMTATGSYYCWVSSSGTVTVRYQAKSTEDPSSGSFTVYVIK